MHRATAWGRGLWKRLARARSIPSPSRTASFAGPARVPRRPIPLSRTLRLRCSPFLRRWRSTLTAPEHSGTPPTWISAPSFADAPHAGRLTRAFRTRTRFQHHSASNWEVMFSHDRERAKVRRTHGDSRYVNYRHAKTKAHTARGGIRPVSRPAPPLGHIHRPGNDARGGAQCGGARPSGKRRRRCGTTLDLRHASQRPGHGARPVPPVQHET